MTAKFKKVVCVKWHVRREGRRGNEKKRVSYEFTQRVCLFSSAPLVIFFNMGENYKRIHLGSYETVLYKLELLKYKIMRHDDLK